jgi:hypothetical protein
VNFLRQLFGGSKTHPPPKPLQATAADATANKAERVKANGDNAPTGSKAELILMIEEMAEVDRGGGIETETKAANAIAASKKFGIDVVKELVTESFFSKLPANVRPNTIRSVSMKIGAAMGGASFGKWLAENIVAGRAPAQMIDDPYKYGAFGMWQDAKTLCEKLGIRFSGPA